MLRVTAFDEFTQLAKHHKYAGISAEFQADELNALDIMRNLVSLYPGLSLFEANDLKSLHRFSFIGLEPLQALRAGAKEGLDKLKTLYETRSVGIPKRAAFLGSLIGYISYDAVRGFEEIPEKQVVEAEFSDYYFRLYRIVLVYDHNGKTLTIGKLCQVSNALQQDYDCTVAEIRQLYHQLFASKPQQKTLPLPVAAQVSMNLSDEAFTDLILKAKAHIKAGDIFQVVLSRKFTQTIEVSAFDIFCAICEVTPSAYQFYIECGDITLVGASPEKLLSVQDNEVITHPLAGTRSRGKSPEEDYVIQQALLSDQKEIAEHVMLVDLSRNDIGRVCQTDSIVVSEFKQIKYYSHVMHISSTVKGQLDGQYDAFDALKALFPAGTLSGAPKIKAMEIIENLEPTRRGIYGGAICLIDHEGHLNSCITIRTAVIKGNQATIQTGAGIVADSIPENEVKETVVKAQGMLSAIAASTRSLA